MWDEVLFSLVIIYYGEDVKFIYLSPFGEGFSAGDLSDLITCNTNPGRILEMDLTTMQSSHET